MNETSTKADAARQGWAAGLARLWLLRPLAKVPSGNALPPTLVMGAIWLLAWIAIDRWQSQPDPEFFSRGIPLLAWYALAVAALAALLHWRSDPAPAFGPVLALAMGAVPVPLLFTGLAAAYLDPAWLLGATVVIAVYLLLYLARGLHAMTGGTQRAAAAVGVVFIVAFAWVTDSLDAIPDVWNPVESQPAGVGEEEPADAEAILFGQSRRIDQALAAIGRDATPGAKAFFLGFAGVGEEKVFAEEIGLASRILGERFGTAARSLSLINDERDLQRAPLASVSGLQYALRSLGSRMNPERDVLFLSISSHGTDEPAIAVSNSNLPLNDLTDEDLADALRDSGIKWRVIIISACYAGGFIDSLKDPQTIIVAASAADRSSFGCSNDRDLTYFGEAFYRDALPAAVSLRAAFEAAKKAVSARERQEHVTPSHPQAYFGNAMEEKLASMKH